MKILFLASFLIKEGEKIMPTVLAVILDPLQAIQILIVQSEDGSEAGHSPRNGIV
ncbi:hypothetical protein Hanom_Chr06g00565591 [Helianthus anomalus]